MWKILNYLHLSARNDQILHTSQSVSRRKLEAIEKTDQCFWSCFLTRGKQTQGKTRLFMFPSQSFIIVAKRRVFSQPILLLSCPIRTFVPCNSSLTVVCPFFSLIHISFLVQLFCAEGAKVLMFFIQLQKRDNQLKIITILSGHFPNHLGQNWKWSLWVKILISGSEQNLGDTESCSRVLDPYMHHLKVFYKLSYCQLCLNSTFLSIRW